jgi:hypothetical protein
MSDESPFTFTVTDQVITENAAQVSTKARMEYKNKLFFDRRGLPVEHFGNVPQMIACINNVDRGDVYPFPWDRALANFGKKPNNITTLN